MRRSAIDRYDLKYNGKWNIQDAVCADWSLKLDMEINSCMGFDVLLTVHLSKILVPDQLNAQILVL